MDVYGGGVIFVDVDGIVWVCLIWFIEIFVFGWVVFVFKIYFMFI